MTHDFIKDDGVRFQIVPSTRKIIVPAAYKVIGTVGDHNSEQLTFQVPLTIDGHDIAKCARRYITWKNANEEIGHDDLVPLGSDEEYLYFTWTIRDGLAMASGLVQFAAHFEDLDGDRIKYRWSTAPCTECEILDTINAILGTYSAMYVAGETLVIADYTPVEDKTLTLDSVGMTPEGTLVITGGGVYDVGQYAQVDVKEIYEKPTITVDYDTGTILAKANNLETTEQIATPRKARLYMEISGENLAGFRVEYVQNLTVTDGKVVVEKKSVPFYDNVLTTNHVIDDTVVVGSPVIVIRQSNNGYKINIFGCNGGATNVIYGDAYGFAWITDYTDGYDNTVRFYCRTAKA